MKLNKKDFLKHRHEFSLGHLTTESFHQKTKNLSNTINIDLAASILLLKDVDSSVLEKLKSYSKNIYELQKSCQSVLENNKVFISGCGATGRLALSIEKLYREKFNKNNVVSFMAGGDYALIRSVESFEDNMTYGEKQLSELGFDDKDLLLGITEGGETSFVIGSVNMAHAVSSVKPWFIYCNPDEELSGIKRSNSIIQNKEINKLNLSVGAMAISGSTRMQATTVQMIAVGFALLYEHKNFEEFNDEFLTFISLLEELDYSFLHKFIDEESSIYNNNGIVTYTTDKDLAISILTDTTERAPTFSLYSFEKDSTENCSLSYISLKNERDVEQVWKYLLGRNIRAVEWSDERDDIGLKDILKFDISHLAVERREKRNSNHHEFNISQTRDDIFFKLNEIHHKVSAKDNLFFKHILLKVLLNTHSTLVMGKLGRIESNVMSFVRPSNYKLIDRALRYIKELLVLKNIRVSDESIIDRIFENIDSGDESIVLKVIAVIEKEENSK
jgi:N-acetylmuramic acid 6-phosphate etherase